MNFYIYIYIMMMGICLVGCNMTHGLIRSDQTTVKRSDISDMRCENTRPCINPVKANNQDTHKGILIDSESGYMEWPYLYVITNKLTGKIFVFGEISGGAERKAKPKTIRSISFNDVTNIFISVKDDRPSFAEASMRNVKGHTYNITRKGSSYHWEANEYADDGRLISVKIVDQTDVENIILMLNVAVALAGTSKDIDLIAPELQIGIIKIYGHCEVIQVTWPQKEYMGRYLPWIVYDMIYSEIKESIYLPGNDVGQL